MGRNIKTLNKAKEEVAIVNKAFDRREDIKVSTKATMIDGLKHANDLYNPKQQGSIKEWNEWSMTPHTEAEIEQKLKENVDSICVSYVCRFSQLSEQFIERMLALTTGYITEDSSDKYIDKMVELMVDKVSTPKKDRTKTVKIKVKEKDGSVNNRDIEDIHDKVDWLYISQYQRLSPEFVMKYFEVLDLTYLAMSNNYGPKFKKLLKDYALQKNKNKKSAKDADFDLDFEDDINDDFEDDFED